MKKVGIVTIVDYDNYGNRLQNYALSQYIEKYGAIAITIKNDQKQTKSLKEYIYKFLTKGLKIIIKKIQTKRVNKKYNAIMSTRRNRFIEFTNKNIKETDYIIDRINVHSDLNKDFDIFIVGSDQIWNPNFRGGMNDFDLLSFADDSKKYSVSASFGTYELNEHYHDHFRDNLKKFQGISVREEAGINIVNNLIGKEPTLLIDPTMAITRDQWQSVIYSHSEKPNGKYILIYALGGINEEMKELLNKIESIDDYVLVSLVDFNHSKYYDVDPFEFVDLIKDADLFITDSYHGVVFSIIFATPFVVTSRTGFNNSISMNSRIDTVLSYFKMNNRRASEIMKNNINFFEIQNDGVQKILEEKMREYDNYIKEILK